MSSAGWDKAESIEEYPSKALSSEQSDSQHYIVVDSKVVLVNGNSYSFYGVFYLKLVGGIVVLKDKLELS